MINQGLFKILELYSNEINIFYNSVDRYFQDKIGLDLKDNVIQKKRSDKFYINLIAKIKANFIEFGFNQENLEKFLLSPIHNYFRGISNKNVSNEYLFREITPFLYEIFLEKIFDYIVDNNSEIVMKNLRSKGLLPIEFIIELRNLKRLLNKNQKKIENLRKYLQIRVSIIQKLIENKNQIEHLDNLDDPLDRLQLFYMIYRIINFFNIQNLFDFSNIKEYIEKNCDNWLDTIPLVSLKNPELYYCGIYLAKQLSVSIDEDNVKYFLLNIYDENIDEFEAPLIEATNKVLFFLESAWICNLGLSDGQIKELLKGNQRFFETNYLKNLETSRLVNILKIYNLLGVYQKTNPLKINSICDEIEKRISSEGVKQYREGFNSSEAIYHVLFFNYMRDNLISMKNSCFFDKIVSRIYRNLEILDFSREINYDLVSEIYFSCECLRLLNCIKINQIIMLFAKNLFPERFLSEILKSDGFIQNISGIRNFKISKVTGELIS